MDDTLEVLVTLGQYTVKCDAGEEQGFEKLAGMLGSTDEMFQTESRLLKERNELEGHVLSLQRTASSFQIQMQKEREMRLKADGELKTLRARNEVLEDQMMNMDAICTQSEARAEENFKELSKDLRELLSDVSKAYLMQYEYLRLRKGFTSAVRFPWIKLKHRIAAMDCLQDMYAEHEKRIKKEPFAELKDASTQINKQEKRDIESAVRKETQSKEHVKPRMVDIGVNTVAAHRVTRATQATEKKTKPIDRSTQCLLLESPNLMEIEEESSVDLNDIFQSTICALPDMLGEIGDLVLPKISSACQTELIVPTANETANRETLTEINNISRLIEYKCPRRRGLVDVSQETEPVKSELLLNKDEGPMEEFEHYWSMAGRSLMGALLDMKPRSDISNGFAGLECIQRQLFQEQMVAKFLNGTVPVKKAVSIPSVYAESTKSGYERDVDGEERLDDEDSRGVPNRSRRIPDDCRSSRGNSVDSTSTDSLVARKRRKTRISLNDPEEANFPPSPSSPPETDEIIPPPEEERLTTMEEPASNPSPRKNCQETDIIFELRDPPERNYVFSTRFSSDGSTKGPSRSSGESTSNRSTREPKSPKQRRVQRVPVNRTVERIRQAKANLYKMRIPGSVMKRATVSRPPSRVGQLKRIRLIKQQEVQERTRVDSGSEVDESKLERIRDFFTLPEFLDPIMDADLLAREELKNDLLLTDSEDSDQEKEMEVQVEEKEARKEAVNEKIVEDTANDRETSSLELNDETSPTQPMGAIHEEPATSPDKFLDYDSPLSPPPMEQSSDPDHVPENIHTESQILQNDPTSKNCMRRLKLTHTTLNQFIQNYTALRKLSSIPKKFDVAAKRIINDYLDAEWTSASVAECVHKLQAMIREDPVHFEPFVVRLILDVMENCSDDLNYEPFHSLAPYMPKTHQMVVQVVERLGLGRRTLQEVEQRIFTLKPEGAKLGGIINWTYMYLTLQDLEMNKNRNATQPLRLFLVKALYYLKNRSIIIVFLTLKAFPKLLPRLERGQSFVVGGHSADPLVDVLVSVLMNYKDQPGAQMGLKNRSEEFSLISKYKSDWKRLHNDFYGYRQSQPSTEDVLRMLLERLSTPGKEMNAVHGILLLAKHKDVAWAQTELLSKELLPRVRELMAGEETEDQLCLGMTVIAGVVKVFPKTEDVSLYRNMFRGVLLDKERFSHRVQECAVVSIIRLSAFGVSEAFHAIRDWYAPTESLSPPLRAVIETFISRQWPQYWVKLSNGE